MFDRKPAVDQDLIDNLALAYNALRQMDQGAEDYVKQVDQIVKLEAIRSAQRPDRIKLDTLVASATNLFGILLIVNHEHVGVVTSKALAFIKPIR